MHADIDRVCDFLEDKVNLGNHWGYIAELWSRGLVRTVKKKRDLRSILMEISQGHAVKDWSRKCVKSEIINQINALCDYSFIYIDEDLLTIPFSFIGMWIPKTFVVEVVSDWRKAQKLNVLKSYFGRFDIFRIATGESVGYDFDYSGDYFDYIRTFGMAERIRLYSNYLKLNSVAVAIKDNSFDNPIYFYDVFLRQFNEYENILKQVNVDSGRFVFLGDGIGIGAIISEKNGWKHWSVERNGIGTMAIKMGIIDAMNLPRKEGKLVVEEGDILVLMNVEEYLKEEEIKEYDLAYSQILVVAENRDSRLGKPYGGTGMKVFIKGVDMIGVPKVRPISVTSDYLKNREPVMPLDLKSAIYSIENKLQISDTGFPISSKNDEGAFNIRTRAYPGNMKFARKGDKKIYKNVKFKYEAAGQVVMSEYEVFKYYPKDVGEVSILYQGEYERIDGFISAVVCRPRRIRRMVDEMGCVVPIYYLRSYKNGDKYVSYYSEKNVGVANTNLTEDYVIRGDDG